MVLLTNYAIHKFTPSLCPAGKNLKLPHCFVESKLAIPTSFTQLTSLKTLLPLLVIILSRYRPLANTLYWYNLFHIN